MSAEARVVIFVSLLLDRGQLLLPASIMLPLKPTGSTRPGFLLLVAEETPDLA